MSDAGAVGDLTHDSAKRPVVIMLTRSATIHGMIPPDEHTDWTPRAQPLGQPAAPVSPAGQFPAGYRPPPRRSRVPLIVGLVTGVLAVATAVVVTAIVMRPSAAPAPAAVAAPVVSSGLPSASPSAVPTAPVLMKLGTTITLGTETNATAYAYRQPVATSATKPDQAGYEWAAIDIKVCALTGNGVDAGITVSPDTWALIYADSGTQAPSNVGYEQFPNPKYPFVDHPLNWGHCIRGWVVFPAPKARRPTMVEYQPGGGDKVFDWKVG